MENVAGVRFSGDSLELVLFTREDYDASLFWRVRSPSDLLTKFCFGELGHVTETHYAAAQILSPRKGGL